MIEMVVLAWVLIFATVSGDETIQLEFYSTSKACSEAFIEATLITDEWSEERIANRPYSAMCYPIHSAYKKAE